MSVANYCGFVTYCMHAVAGLPGIPEILYNLERDPATWEDPLSWYAIDTLPLII